MEHKEIGERFLAHYGIKGQKWGVRRSKKAIQRSADSQRHHENAKKPLAELSDKELKDLQTRLQTEKNVKQLQASGQSMTKRLLSGANTANALLGAAKSPAAIAVAAGGAALAVKLLKTSGAVSTIGKF